MKKQWLCWALLPFMGVGNAWAENLAQIYDLALQNDLQLRIARANRDSALEAKPQAGALSLPTVDLRGNANGVRNDISGATSGNGESTFTTADLSLNLTQALYRPANAIQQKQADLQVAQAEVTYAAEEQNLIVRVARAYFDVLSAQDSLEFAEAENAAIGRQLEQARQRFEVGLIAITAVHEAQAAYDQSRADLISAQNALDNAWEALHEITLQQVGALARVVPKLPLAPPVPKDQNQWAEAAQTQNLTVQAARYGADIARENIDLQDSGDDPTLDLVGSHRLATSSAANGSESQNTTLGVSLNVPLYTGGAVSSRTRQARLDYLASQETLDRERRTANRDVRDAYRAVLANISSVEALRASTTSAQSALEATEAGFEVGTRTIVDVLNAQRDLFRARRNLASARYNYLVSGLQLKQAAGSLSPEDLQQVNGLLN